MEAALQKGVASAMQSTEGTVALNICALCHTEYPPDFDICPRDGGTLMPLAQELLLGTLLNDRYNIESIIGQGSMGVVYRATHKTIGRPVAIKMLNWRLVSNPRSIKRFEREAQATSRLNHANVVAVHDVGLAPTRQPYIVMDFAEGVSLGEHLKSVERFSIPRAINIFLQICAALNHAHEKGVIHRDLKPSNIILNQDSTGDDHVKVVDFGVAKLAHPDGEQTDNLTKTGEVIGTPAYMSPEQCMSRPLDARSDVYSLGILMYHVLAGKPPFVGMNTLETMGKQVMEMPSPFFAVGATHVPDALEQIIFRCLCKFPHERYQTMAELYVNLQDVAYTMAADGSSRRQTSSSPSRTRRTESGAEDLEALAGILERQRQRSLQPSAPPLESERFDCSPEPGPTTQALAHLRNSQNKLLGHLNEHSNHSNSNQSAIRDRSSGSNHAALQRASGSNHGAIQRASGSDHAALRGGSTQEPSAKQSQRIMLIAPLAVVLATVVITWALSALKSVPQSASSEQQVNSEVDRIWSETEDSQFRPFNANIPQAALGVRARAKSIQEKGEGKANNAAATNTVISKKPASASSAATISKTPQKTNKIAGGILSPRSVTSQTSLAYAQSTFESWFGLVRPRKEPNAEKNVPRSAPPATRQNGAIAMRQAPAQQQDESAAPSIRQEADDAPHGAPTSTQPASTNAPVISSTSLVDLNNQGVAAMNARNYPSAIRFFEEALKVDSHYKKAVINLCNTFNNYATALHQENKLAEAEVMYKKALSMREREFGMDSRDLIPTLDNYSALLRALDRESEAKKIEARILAIRAQ